MRGLRFGALAVAVATGCSLIDSVNGYEGPPASGGSNAGGADAGHDGSGGSGAGDAALDVSSACVGAADCDDQNPCTDDSCWGNACRHEPKPGASCSDNNVCNGNEVCDATGKCQKGTPLPLDDDNPCTDDACDPKLGVTHTLQTNPPPVIVQCGTVTCPSGYYVSKLTCLSQCGACNPTYCVNGVECTRVCEKKLSVCCGNTCGGECPPGYSQTATSVTGDCGCGPGNTGTCQR